MDPIDPALEQYENERLLEFPRLEHWKVLKARIERRLNEETEEIELRPQMSDTDLTLDIRWRLATVATLKWVLRIPDETRENYSQEDFR